MPEKQCRMTHIPSSLAGNNTGVLGGAQVFTTMSPPHSWEGKAMKLSRRQADCAIDEQE